MAQRPLESPRRPILEGLVRGLLPLYVLHLLEEAPAHGAGIAATIAEMTGGVWSPSPGSLYPTLKRLEREGLVRGRWARGTAAPRRVSESPPLAARPAWASGPRPSTICARRATSSTCTSTPSARAAGPPAPGTGRPAPAAVADARGA